MERKKEKCVCVREGARGSKGETEVLPCVLFPHWYGKGDSEWHRGMKRSRWRRTAIQDPIRRKQLLKSSEMYGMSPETLCSTAIEKSHNQFLLKQKRQKGSEQRGEEKQLIVVSGYMNGFLHRHCVKKSPNPT